MKRFWIHTFGCQMNTYDSERLQTCLQAAGWTAADREEEADLLLANTCTVRHLAEAKAFSLLGIWAKRKQSRPGLRIGMVGCLAQHLQQQVFQRQPAVDFLAGPRALMHVPLLAEAAASGPQADFSTAGFGAGAAGKSGVCAFVGVMEGCNQGCSYCAVPQSRGREASRPAEDILAEIRRRVAGGGREICLLAQNITRYGRDLPQPLPLEDLLQRASGIPGLLRLRFLTGHPKSFTGGLIRVMADNPQICESLHLPLQSGSDRILKTMRRGYTAGEYLTLIESIRLAVPGLELSTDLIVGFPGESDDDFEATLETVRRLEFNMAYCFSFSPRPGTDAEKMPDQVPAAVKEERLQKLLALVEATIAKKMAALIGTRQQVLVEGRDERTGQYLRGRTRGNYVVQFPGAAEWIGNEKSVDITAAGRWTLMGEAADEPPKEKP